MEHHRQLGIGPRVRDLCLPINRPTDVSYYSTLTGWELGRIPMPSEADKRRAVAASAATDQIPEPLLARQSDVRRGVPAGARAHAAQHHHSLRLAGDRPPEDADGVTVEAESDGGRESWRAQYLAGCDGGRSFVRRALALRYSGFASLDSPHYGGRQNATYFRAPTLYRDHLAHRPGWNYWVVHPKGRCTILSLNDDEEFLAFSKAPDDGTPPSDEAAIATIVRAVGAELPIKIIGHWPWTAGVALVADRFVTNRVVLAGDAVHLFTPTGGFGMNTGMDDASNLAWKLAALVQGWGGAGLLASYETERKPIAHRNTTAARELNKQLANMPDVTAVRRQFARRRRNAPQGQRASRRDDRGIRLARRAAWRALRRLADCDGGRRPAGRQLRALHPLRRAGRPRPALLARRRARLRRLAVRPVRQGLHAAAARRQAAGYEHDRSRSAASVACRSRSSTCRRPTPAISTAATLRSFGPTNMSPGAAMRRRPMPTA